MTTRTTFLSALMLGAVLLAAPLAAHADPLTKEDVLKAAAAHPKAASIAKKEALEHQKAAEAVAKDALEHQMRPQGL